MKKVTNQRCKGQIKESEFYQGLIVALKRLKTSKTTLAILLELLKLIIIYPIAIIIILKG